MTDYRGKWKHSQDWKLQGENFCVSIHKHQVPREGSPSLESHFGVHRWAVYAYIYPAHPLFAVFDGTSMFQRATGIMPLHAGCSYLQRHFDNDAKLCSIQVGADYGHLHDARYTHMVDSDQAICVFEDAENLFEWLKDYPK